MLAVSWEHISPCPIGGLNIQWSGDIWIWHASWRAPRSAPFPSHLRCQNVEIDRKGALSAFCRKFGLKKLQKGFRLFLQKPETTERYNFCRKWWFLQKEAIPVGSFATERVHFCRKSSLSVNFCTFCPFCFFLVSAGTGHFRPALSVSAEMILVDV